MWDWAIWGALIVGWLAGIAAVALLFVRVREAWRELKDARRDVVHRLGELGRKGEATAEKAAAAGETAELQESLGRLRVSLAQLAVLRSALDEAQLTVGRATWLIPHK
jgi:hypothetical protein